MTVACQKRILEDLKDALYDEIAKEAYNNLALYPCGNEREFIIELWDPNGETVRSFSLSAAIDHWDHDDPRSYSDMAEALERLARRLRQRAAKLGTNAVVHNNSLASH